MARKKGDKKSKVYDRELLWNVISNMKVPILTLDERWNILFAEIAKKPEVKKSIKMINELLKEQGGVVNKTKEMKVLKKRLMTNIVDNMAETSDEAENNRRNKKQDASQRLILDINEKLERSKDRLMELPYEIMQYNRQLLFESLVYGYSVMEENTEKSEQLAADIERLSEELDEKIKQKELVDKQSNAMYSFMHDMIGAQVLEKIDSEVQKK